MSLFGEGAAVGEAAGWAAGITGIIVAAGGVLVAVLAARGKGKQASERGAVRHLSAIVDRQEKQIALLLSHGAETDKELASLTHENGLCHDDYADLYGIYADLHGFARRLATACKSLGNDPGELPPLRPRRPRPDRGKTEFKRRTLEQTSMNLQSLSGAISQQQQQEP
jgi:hypothetical protein